MGAVSRLEGRSEAITTSLHRWTFLSLAHPRPNQKQPHLNLNPLYPPLLLFTATRLFTRESTLSLRILHIDLYLLSPTRPPALEATRQALATGAMSMQQTVVASVVEVLVVTVVDRPSTVPIVKMIALQAQALQVLQAQAKAHPSLAPLLL